MYVHRQRAYDAVRALLVAAHDCVVPPSDATPPPPTAGAPVYLSELVVS